MLDSILRNIISPFNFELGEHVKQISKIFDRYANNFLRILNQPSLSIYHKILSLCCSLKLIPFEWDRQNKCLAKGLRRTWTIFTLHLLLNSALTIFSIVRLMNALSKDNFPLLLRILKTAWIGIYSLTCICHYQFLVDEGGIRQFLNWLLLYIETDLRQDYALEQEIPNLHDYRKIYTMYKLSQKKQRQSRLGYYLFVGMALWILNPGIHAMLVYESPCAPHFTSSLFLPCDDFKNDSIPLIAKIPFIFVEYYLTTIIFTSFSFNWAIIFLGLSWVVDELKSMSDEMRETRSIPSLAKYRSIECILATLNASFRPYLSSFPTILFAVVSLLLFGVIRIWHYTPGSNLMFPICGARCYFEGVTPLSMAGDVNDRNKELLSDWKDQLIKRKENQSGKGKRLNRAIKRSLRGVKCRAGSLYIFERSIVLTALNNMMQVTLNLLITFKLDYY